MISQRKIVPSSLDDDTLNTLLEQKWFLTLYLKSSSWKVELKPEDHDLLLIKGYCSSKLCCLDFVMYLQYSNAVWKQCYEVFLMKFALFIYMILL